MQVVVLEGDPCKTASYQLKECIDFTDQADFFVVLDSLTAGQEYLINIDGFLGDECSFDISIKNQPEGLPIQVPITERRSLQYTQQDSVVTLHWNVDQAEANTLQGFFVFRKKRGDSKSHQLESPGVLNTFGAAAREYSITDTLHEYGEYSYRVYMNSANGVVQLDQVTIQHKSSTYLKVFPKYKRQFDFYVRNPGIVRLAIQTPDKKTISLHRIKCSEGMNSVVLDFSSLVGPGQKRFVVAIKGKDIDEGRPVSFE